MDGIFFLLLAIFTVLASIKLSYYGDILSKQTKIGSAFIGGLLIAAVTSFPELITSISAVILNNPTLSFGDIVGSNMFNIFVLGIYNIYFFKSEIFKNIHKKHMIECLILIIDYVFIILGTYSVILNYVSVILFIMYLVYMIYIIFDKSKEEDIKYEKEEYPELKFIVTAVVMVVLSIFLTYQADKISKIYPSFSSSTIGAILLGITTSLPEVVTTFELLRLNNFNMAISNMLGSNIFNFLVLSLSDIFIKLSSIYEYSDKYSLFYLLGGLFVTILLLSMIKSNRKNNIFYLVISMLIIISYLYIWYLQFT